jgi:hypothetical protein
MHQSLVIAPKNYQSLVGTPKISEYAPKFLVSTPEISKYAPKLAGTHQN